MNPRNDATERQVQAARPNTSTWLAANAGSGKTRVLTDRVARLLLDEVEPQHILCLTYTKAAASEMQNRLFDRLGDWAMLDDTRLTRALADLGVERDLTPERLRQARTLFARAIETPGGLKIQTIHSFCASLLRRFPLEAGVSPQFTEMEDRAATLLCDEILDDFSGGPERGLVDGLAGYVSDEGLQDLVAAIANHREKFPPKLSWNTLQQAFNLPDGFDESQLLATVFLGGEPELIRSILPALQAGGVTDQKNAVKLAGIIAPDMAALGILEDLMLTGATAQSPYSAKIGSFPSKGAQKSLVGEMPQLESLMLRVEAARERRVSLAAARKSMALHAFAAAFLPEYARRKQLRGWLDFDDLIVKSRQLLNDPAVAEWVLFRLDGGIDHILVDEAQDTSPDQWVVIEKLAQEFTSGQGARGDTVRTIFVVGDKKQSIYSFQGADPEAFDKMQAEFGARLRDSGTSLESLTLEYSFRSSQVILQLVDLVFEGQGESGFQKESLHRAFKSDLPGRVDLWPVVEKVSDDDDRSWSDPVDRPGAQHHTVVLAERIASSIKAMIDGGETIPIDGDAPGKFARKPVQAGDFLILLQRRSDLFAEIIRACKAADLPIAGADRLKVGAELAVKDLAAVLMFLATPEDNLALATALRSPLFGWSEQQLFDLSHRRDGPFLWKALRDRATEFPDTLAVIDELRGQTDFLRPYDLIERILTRHDGRRKLLARLGPEAEDGINALLSQALAYERSDVPSLTGFLIWMETDDLEIKRQADSGGNLIRVMTVHGAKGLEAPIVILPDTAKRRAPRGQAVMAVDGLPLWRTDAASMPEALRAAHGDTQQREMNERMRLLYVAMTRAEKWLIVTAAGELDKEGNSWYQMIEAAMTHAGATTVAYKGGPGLRLYHGNWAGGSLRDNTVEQSAAPPLPDLFRNSAVQSPEPAKTLSPSDLGGAKALPGDLGLDEEAAMLRGTQIHLLLERLPELPPHCWPEVAQQLLHQLDSNQVSELLAEADQVLKSQAVVHLFTAGTLAEVQITGDIANQRIHGTIDRLIVSDAMVLAIDFKTNATVPDGVETIPEGLLRQLGAYAHVLKQIYPDRQVQTAILWTRTAQLMQVPHETVTQALRRSPRLDDGRVHS